MPFEINFIKLANNFKAWLLDANIIRNIIANTNMYLDVGFEVFVIIFNLELNFFQIPNEYLYSR